MLSKAFCSTLLLLGLAASTAAAIPVDQVSTPRLTFVIDGNALQIPYSRNMPLSGSYPDVDRAAVMVHGSQRDAPAAYSNLRDAATIVGVPDSTALLIAPQFLTEEDVTFYALAPTVLFWGEQGWKQGDKSLSTASNPRPAVISTFALMDSILYRLASQNQNLRKVVVAGHSAGGQFVNRYAAGNTMEELLKNQFGVDVSYIVANASSYMYFDSERVVSGTYSIFETPSAEVVQWCPEYDSYKYGLQDLNSYMTGVGASQILSQFPSRHVHYLLGTLDTDPQDPSLDTTCPASLQGPYRLLRGLIYGNYLGYFFGASALVTHRVILIPGVGHSSSGMFGSDCGAHLLLEGTYCGPAAAVEQSIGTLAVPNPLRTPATVEFSLPHSGEHVTLRLYDVRGRVVRTLVDGPEPAGLQYVIWDGTSDTGVTLPTGVYVWRLVDGSEVSTRKITVLR